MPAMDFCNTMEFPLATLWIFNLQLSVFLSYNKHPAEIITILIILTYINSILFKNNYF